MSADLSKLDYPNNTAEAGWALPIFGQALAR